MAETFDSDETRARIMESLSENLIRNAHARGYPQTIVQICICFGHEGLTVTESWARDCTYKI